MKLLTGNAHPTLAQGIADQIGTSLADAEVTSFPDGETYVRINENVRRQDVFLIQPTCPPTNQNLMELLIMVDAVRRARTGAAISETETHFYNDLLGTTRYDPDYLQGLMGTIVSSINAQSEDQYKALFSQRYGRPPVASELSDMNARLLYQTDIGGGSKKTRVSVSVDEAKNE